ncbi:hypothetical protein K402DRAFT_409971 [Aulographum hederae CBS 113979]|uniref:GIY-YIG domain-containing protein n=1 Tax=Aulographum hederae CBS 113979 TaxID=1176131 RepID=A0A6G1HD30_9PEZI|nr:hypothetical protein K402DRAFT_409971 [Aulographum hederae CBS 113979]
MYAMDRPIPAFYCCYLLRSIKFHSSLYVGSTPHPVRRLKQHNGTSTGGAKRTSKEKLRPWEMTCIVTGFPSKIAALQFEWAWQNTHLTRHIPSEDRITKTKTKVRISPRSGRERKRPERPSMSLTDRVANLQLLLSVKSFGRWPLAVKFFSEDVFRVWQQLVKRAEVPIRKGINVVLETGSVTAQVAATQPEAALEINIPKGIDALDVGYGGMKEELEKSRELMSLDVAKPCVVCKHGIQANEAMTLVCPNATCNALSHVTCLSSHFLQQEQNSQAMLPTEGKCPKCHKTVQWAGMVRDLSLRTRGEKELEKLFKTGSSQAAQEPAHFTEEDSWIYQQFDSEDGVPFSDEDEGNDERPPSRLNSPIAVKTSQKPKRRGKYVLDSDWSDSDILD